MNRKQTSDPIDGNNSISLDQLAQLLSQFAPQVSPAQLEMQERLNNKLKKEEAEAAEAERVALEMRKQGALSLQRKRDEDLAKQESCPHIKPNRLTALSGQRDHSHNVHYICQFCAKEFSGNNVPHHLIPDPMLIGGPIL